MGVVDPRFRTLTGAGTRRDSALAATVRTISGQRHAEGGRLWRHPPEPVSLVFLDLAALATIRPASAWDLVIAAIVLSTYLATGLYQPRLSLSVLDDLPRLAGGIAIAVMSTGSVAALANQPVAPIYERAVLLAASLLAFRLLSYSLLRRWRAMGFGARRALLIGAGQVGTQLAQTLQKRPEYGLRVVGFLDRHAFAAHRLPAPLLGKDRDLVDAVGQYDISVVIIAFGNGSSRDLVELLRGPWRQGCDIFVVPRLFEVQARGRIDHIGCIPLARLRQSTVTTWSWKVKRFTDVMGAVILIILLSPLMVLTAVAVRIESGGGVLFRQERVGRNGRPFTMLKFCSVRPVDDAESCTLWTLNGDGRLGPVGRLIRRTSMDELPQLFNVLRGEMSLVGPRPERPHFVDQFAARFPSYQSRHRVRAGLTGWAAVNGLRGDTSIEERAQFDNIYIDNWSLWVDVKILLRTVPAVLGGTGE